MDPGQGGKILLCVTGGISAYKVVEVARSLTGAGAEVRVVMTQAALAFVGEQTFGPLTGHPVATELFTVSGEVPHVELARGADLAIVAPASADALAKMAHGLGGDLFSATMLTVRCPVLVAPAMHTEMWEHPATEANVATLRARGVRFVGPATGALSSGDAGIGRMSEPEEIVAAAWAILERAQTLAHRYFVVTAGGTQEPIDPVRFIGNRSSGRMGYAIAAQAAARGARVTLISGPTELQAPAGVETVYVATANHMRAEVLARAGSADAIVKAAAVADFRPKLSADAKLKKAEGAPEVILEPTPDILAELGASPRMRKPGSVLVGFAAETEPDARRLTGVALSKRGSKGADVIVANDVSSPDSGFEVPTNRAVIAGPRGVTELGLVTKEQLASHLLDTIASLLE